MKRKIIFIILICVLSVVFAGCREETDLEKIMDYWLVDNMEEKRVHIVFYEPHEEGFVRDTFLAPDASLSVMEQKYGEFKPSKEGNVCGDVSFKIWDVYKQEDNTDILDNERNIYGIYELDSMNKTIALNILIDEDQVIVEEKAYRYEFEDSSHLTLINLEDSSERVELYRET